MKFPLLFFGLALIQLATSCQQGGGKNDPDYSLATDQSYTQIANAFRSESKIVVEEGTENYMGQFNHKLLIEDMFEAIYAGRIKAYDYMDTPLTIEEVQYIQSHTDTADIEDIETGEVESVVIIEELNPDEVVKVFTVEDWYLNKETFKMEKKMISMTLTTLKLNLEGDPIGYEILFKVFLDGRDQLQ
ncbi:MAG: hypothetical protein JKY52_11365 [Flavobacteriales bacterium]|nr:hypothetical protein [Flavobacteriales bacterium]